MTSDTAWLQRAVWLTDTMILGVVRLDPQSLASLRVSVRDRHDQHAARVEVFRPTGPISGSRKNHHSADGSTSARSGSPRRPSMIDRIGGWLYARRARVPLARKTAYRMVTTPGFQWSRLARWRQRYGDHETLLVVHWASVRSGRPPARELIMQAGARSARYYLLDDVAESSALTDVVQEYGARLGYDVRDEVHAFLLATLNGFSHENRPREIAAAQRRIDEALTEPPPRITIHQNQALGLYVDYLLQIDAQTYYVKGWARSQDAPLARLTVRSPLGDEADILETAYRYPRLDVEQFYGTPAEHLRLAHPGFIATFTLTRSAMLRTGWTVDVEDAHGAIGRTAIPDLVQDVRLARQSILNDIMLERPPSDQLLGGHAHTALAALQRLIVDGATIERIVPFGEPPPEPAVSIVIPLYRRLDLMEHQWAQFFLDADLRRADVIYVLDSPDDEPALLELARQLHALYDLSCRIVIMTHNGGYARACNAGASIARGRLLLLMNSDVLPAHPGWLTTMVQFFASTPGIGALGARLLYEDNSLQHAGMEFVRPPSPPQLAGYPFWENHHRFSGLDANLPQANVAQPAPAVTGACMLVDKHQFDELGGLSTEFVMGDFEDSDYCLKLAEIGLTTWYLPAAVLYHLEAQSYPTEQRGAALRYNAWLHTRKWSPLIETVMARFTLGDAPPITTGAATIKSIEPAGPNHSDKAALRALIVQELARDYVSSSCKDGIKTGNHYQSILLDDELTAGFRSSRHDVLDQLEFEGASVLDLGCNLGEMSREARRRGASFVTGIEYDQHFVRVARLINTYQVLNNITIDQGDITNAATYRGRYDIVLAFSVFTYIDTLIDRIAAITDGVLILETHRLEDNLESTYLSAILPHFPYFRVIGHSDWSADTRADAGRIVIAFAKEPGPLRRYVRSAPSTDWPGLADPPALDAPEMDGATIQAVDVKRTTIWYDRFFNRYPHLSPQEVIDAVAQDVWSLPELLAEPDLYADLLDGWSYWWLYINGWRQYQASGGVFDDNIYYQFMTRHALAAGIDQGIAPELQDSEQSRLLVLRRYADFDVFAHHAADGSTNDVGTSVLQAVATHRDATASQDVYLIGSGEPVHTRFIDGYHRLFLARLFRVAALPAVIFREPDELPPLPGTIEDFWLDSSRLMVRGFVDTREQEIFNIGVRIDGATIARVPKLKPLPDQEPDPDRASFLIDVEGSFDPDQDHAISIVGYRALPPVGMMRIVYRPGMFEPRLWPPDDLAQRFFGSCQPEVMAFRSLKWLTEILTPLHQKDALGTITRVLDWGAGPGVLHPFLPALLSGATVVALEGDDEALTWCQRSQLPGDFRPLPRDPVLDQPSGWFDLIIGHRTLDRLDPKQRAPWLAELMRVTRSGGVIALSASPDVLDTLYTRLRRHVRDDGHGTRLERFTTAVDDRYDLLVLEIAGMASQSDPMTASIEVHG